MTPDFALSKAIEWQESAARRLPGDPEKRLEERLAERWLERAVKLECETEKLKGI